MAKANRESEANETPKSEAEILAEVDAMIAAMNAKKAEIEGARAKRATEYLAALTEAATILPHPSGHAIEATDERPMSFLVTFGSDGKVTVKAPPATLSKGSTKSSEPRAGSSDLYALGYQAGDKVCRLVRTEAVAKHGGYSDLETVISATILDSKTMESANAKGATHKGTPTGTGRHAAGAGNESGLYEPSLDGYLFWFRDPSSYVVREGKRLEIDRLTGQVKN
jgi:hypothetical protein